MARNKKTRETRFINWSDGRLTVIYREVSMEDGQEKLSEYTETHSYPAEEVEKLRDELNRR